MKLKVYLTVKEVAELIEAREPTDLDIRRYRRHFKAAGALVRLPGYRIFHIPTPRLRDLFPDAFDRMCTDSRFWEDECTHPHERIRALGPDKWCQVCGSIYADGEWHAATGLKGIV